MRPAHKWFLCHILCFVVMPGCAPGEDAISVNNGPQALERQSTILPILDDPSRQQSTPVKNSRQFVSLELERAVLESNEERVEELLSSNVSPMGRTRDGRQILHIASEFEDTRIPLMLIRCGATQDVASDNGETPMDVLIRKGFVTKELRDESYADVQIARTIIAIEQSVEKANACYTRGVELIELMQLRAELLAESERDREHAIQMVSVLSFGQTGSRATGPSPSELMIPYEDRSSNPMWRSLRLNGELSNGFASVSGWENTYQAKPLPEDLYKPLELPIPPQFDDGIELVRWCLVRTALVYGTESEHFKSFLIQVRQFVEESNKAKRMRW